MLGIYSRAKAKPRGIRRNKSKTHQTAIEAYADRPLFSASRRTGDRRSRPCQRSRSGVVLELPSRPGPALRSSGFHEIWGELRFLSEVHPSKSRPIGRLAAPRF